MTNIFSNQTVGGAGFFDGIDILDTVSTAFGTYALSTAIGPVSGRPIIIASFPYPTGLGSFQITSVSGDATFTAAVATPEPSSMFMLGTGLLGVLGIWKGQR